MLICIKRISFVPSLSRVFIDALCSIVEPFVNGSLAEKRPTGALLRADIFDPSKQAPANLCTWALELAHLNGMWQSLLLLMPPVLFLLCYIQMSAVKRAWCERFVRPTSPEPSNDCKKTEILQPDKLKPKVKVCRLCLKKKKTLNHTSVIIAVDYFELLSKSTDHLGSTYLFFQDSTGTQHVMHEYTKTDFN